MFLLFTKTHSFIKINWSGLQIMEPTCPKRVFMFGTLEKTVRTKTLHNGNYVLWVVYYV